MAVDFNVVAAQMESAAAFIRREFLVMTDRRTRRVFAGLTLALFAAVCVAPLAALAWRSLFEGGAWHLDAWRAVLAEPANGPCWPTA